MMSLLKGVCFVVASSIFWTGLAFADDVIESRILSCFDQFRNGMGRAQVEINRWSRNQMGQHEFEMESRRLHCIPLKKFIVCTIMVGNPYSYDVIPRYFFKQFQYQLKHKMHEFGVKSCDFSVDDVMEELGLVVEGTEEDGFLTSGGGCKYVVRGSLFWRNVTLCSAVLVLTFIKYIM